MSEGIRWTEDLSEEEASSAVEDFEAGTAYGSSNIRNGETQWIARPTAPQNCFCFPETINQFENELMHDAYPPENASSATSTWAGGRGFQRALSGISLGPRVGYAAYSQQNTTLVAAAGTRRSSSSSSSSSSSMGSHSDSAATSPQAGPSNSDSSGVHHTQGYAALQGIS